MEQENFVEYREVNGQVWAVYDGPFGRLIKSMEEKLAAETNNQVLLLLL